MLCLNIPPEQKPTRANQYHSLQSLLTSSLNTIAVNLPVLNNAERAEVGTLHNSRVKWHISITDLWKYAMLPSYRLILQENGVSLKPRARQLGAAYISANTSQHLLKHFLGKELTYKPLIYCWRGGQRSRLALKKFNNFNIDSII